MRAQSQPQVDAEGPDPADANAGMDQSTAVPSERFEEPKWAEIGQIPNHAPEEVPAQRSQHLEATETESAVEALAEVAPVVSQPVVSGLAATKDGGSEIRARNLKTAMRPGMTSGVNGRAADLAAKPAADGASSGSTQADVSTSTQPAKRPSSEPGAPRDSEPDAMGATRTDNNPNSLSNTGHSSHFGPGVIESIAANSGAAANGGAAHSGSSAESLHAMPRMETGEAVSRPNPSRVANLPAAGSSGIDTARLIRTMGESEMRVGLRGGELGEVAIRTWVAEHRMVTRIEVDHAALGQAIATEAAALEAKLGTQYGLHARIEVNSQSGMLSGGDHGSAQQEPQRQTGTHLQAEQMDTMEVPAAVLSPVQFEHGSRIDVHA